LSLRSWRRVQQINQRLQQQQESEESQSDEESQSEQEESESDVEDEFVEAEESRRSEIVLSSSPANSENYEVIFSEQTSESRPQPRRNSPREGRRASERYGALVMKHVFASYERRISTGYAGVEVAVPVSVQVRLLRNSQNSLEEKVVRFLVVSTSPLQQTRLRHRFQTSLVLTEILHLIAILLTLVVAEVVDLFVVLDANFSVAIQLI
jgi:hypothetical protein